MCKHLAWHGKQSYPSVIATLRLGSFSFIQRDYDALVPFLRNHFLFPDLSDYFVQCAWHHCHRVGCTLDRYRILLVPCLP